MSFQFLLCADRGKLPETSGTEKASYGCGLVGYQSFRTTCRGTYGNEAKAIPRIRIYQVSLLTGDALTRSAARRGNEKAAMALEPENPAWVRSARSSPRGVMTLTWRRGTVIAH